MTDIVIDDLDRERLAGTRGKAEQLAMRMLVAAAETSGATEFVPIEFAHIGSCHYTGRLAMQICWR